MKYVIDFERLNELTSHPNDNPNTGGYQSSGTFVFSTTRKIIKEYLEIYSGVLIGKAPALGSNFDAIVDTLLYNKILLSESDLRDNKIKSILDEPF